MSPIALRWDGSRFVEALRLETSLGTAAVSLSLHTPEPVDLAAVAHTAAEHAHGDADALAGALAEALLAASPAALQATVDLQLRGTHAHATRGRDAPLRPLTTIPDSVPIAIIGAGVAGLSAALWVRRFHQRAIVIDPQPPGGQLALIHFPIPDLPGMPPTRGHALRAQYRRQFLLHGGQWAQAAVSAITSSDGGYTLQLGTRTLSARAVIVATGIRRRTLGLPGQARFVGCGLLDTASRHTDGIAGKTVVVVGGGDAALENALKLSRLGARVVLVHRRQAFTARRAFAAQAEADPAISVRLGRAVVGLRGEAHLEQVILDSGEHVAAAYLLVRIGWEPNTEALPAAWRGPRGYIRCDASLRVAPGVFVAGDVRNPGALSVANAAGDGTVAGRSAVTYLSGAPVETPAPR